MQCTYSRRAAPKKSNVWVAVINKHQLSSLRRDGATVTSLVSKFDGLFACDWDLQHQEIHDILCGPILHNAAISRGGHGHSFKNKRLRKSNFEFFLVVRADIY